jgi:hypothetical protein
MTVRDGPESALTDLICAENPREADGRPSRVPQADKPDF